MFLEIARQMTIAWKNTSKRAERQPLTDEERMLVEIVGELVHERIAPRAQ